MSVIHDPHGSNGSTLLIHLSIRLSPNLTALPFSSLICPTPPFICNAPSISSLMDENWPNVVDCETLSKKNKQKFVWDNTALMYFLNACLHESKEGNRPGTHFTKVGWANIVNTMIEKTGRTFSQKQIKNKWDCIKKDWKLYDRLMRLETGIGGTRSLIDASPEWWEEKIKVDKDFAKFKGANLEIFETHYAPLFRDSVATGDQAMTSLQLVNVSNPSDVQREENIEGKGDSDEICLDYETLFPTFVGSSSSKRKKNVSNKRATKSKTLSFEEKLDVVLDALSAKSTETSPPIIPSPTIEDCMDIVNTFPGYEEGSKKYTQALLAFIKKEHRVVFMYPKTHEAKMEVLKALVKE